ncbi:MAG TPA: MFS transporter [Methylomirabilota bacterium]|jgi:MFS family permease
MTPRRWLAAAREPRWRALAGAFATVVLAQGLSNSFPVFLLPLSTELGGLRSLSAAVFSAHNLVMGLVGTVVDVLMRRLGERPVMLAGALILGGGVALAATADSPLGLLFWFGGVAGVGAGLLGSVAQLVILSRWFPTARGAVNGVAFSGMGLGIFLFAPLSALLVDHVGWRGAMAGLGMGTGLLLLPAVVLPPRRAGERPRAPDPSLARTEEGTGLASAVATARFWCFAAAFFFTPVSNFMVTTHQIAHIVEAGIDPRRAAAAFGAIGLLSAVGRVTFGTLSDRWGRVPTALASYVATAAGTLALLLLAPGAPGWLLWAYVLPFGLTLGARGPIVAALTADVYRGRSFGTVLGVITFGNRLGSAIGPWLGGVIYDVTGSYRLAFTVSIASLAVAAVAFAAAGRSRPGD